ncbi:hypothetical protein LXA43DRAFT_891382 [Ganoderma leucocontextum]|nr:hypothetical protein LXA43DRAFT_891382 [Ganoderma leucocontextum]
MDVQRARSPPVSLTRRPIGPRSPGKPGSLPVKNIVPLDLTARLQSDEFGAFSRTSSPVSVGTGSGSPRPESPAFRPPPVLLHRNVSAPSSSSSERTPTPPAVFSPPAPEVSPPETPSVPSKPRAPSESPPPPPRPPSDILPPDVSVALDVSSPALLDETGPTPPPHPPSDLSAPDVSMHAVSPPDVSMHAANGLDGYAHKRTLSEKSVQASIVVSGRPGTPASTSRASTPALLKTIPKRPPLASLPNVNFDSEPVKWKALTLEAAQWTFTSEQLQEIVSGAIRQSAAESFIRVLPTQVADAELPQEAERLEQLRTTTQAQYRFNMHRRAMLLQSLAALSQSQQSESDGEPLYNLTTQLAELTASCDRLMESLVRIADQKAQLARLLDLHVASALAMALRKLNASYAKRSAELQETRARNEEIKAELEEAWNMAQDMAQEMDDLDNFNLDFTDEEFTPDRDDRRNSHLSYLEDHDDEDFSYSALEAEIHGDMDRMSGISSMRNVEVVEITGKAVATKAVMLTSGAPAPAPPDSGDRTSRVVAAKKRSSRTSKASLRIPKTPTDGNGELRERPDRSSIYSLRRRRSQSRSVRRAGGRNGESVKDTPGVPIIRLPEPKSRDASFLELSQTRPASPAASTPDLPPPLPPKEGTSPGLQMNIAASRSEEVLPSQHGSDPSASPNSDELLGIPTINIAEEGLGPLPSQENGPPSSWRGRRFFTRRTQSMQSSVRPADDDTAAMKGGQSSLKRSASEAKQFDGWPFLGVSKSQRFSVPVLSVMQPLKGRKSSDSDPAGHQ